MRQMLKIEYLEWLKEKTEKDWGKKCLDYEPTCALCGAWNIYERVRKLLKVKNNKKI